MEFVTVKVSGDRIDVAPLRGSPADLRTYLRYHFISYRHTVGLLRYN